MNKNEIIRNVAAVSSGSLGSLTGLSDYAEIDQFHQDWILFVEVNATEAIDGWWAAFLLYVGHLYDVVVKSEGDMNYTIVDGDSCTHVKHGRNWIVNGTQVRYLAEAIKLAKNSK